jgi:hypothetical protein
MTKISKDKDESQLANLTKSLLAMPHKLREDSKFGKPHRPKKKAKIVKTGKTKV